MELDCADFLELKLTNKTELSMREMDSAKIQQK
jgi:hypothetical protein